MNTEKTLIKVRDSMGLNSELALAKKLGITPPSIRHWRIKDRIPERWRLSLIHEHGVPSSIFDRPKASEPQ